MVEFALRQHVLDWVHMWAAIWESDTNEACPFRDARARQLVSRLAIPWLSIKITANGGLRLAAALGGELGKYSKEMCCLF